MVILVTLEEVSTAKMRSVYLPCKKSLKTAVSFVQVAVEEDEAEEVEVEASSPPQVPIGEEISMIRREVDSNAEVSLSRMEIRTHLVIEEEMSV